MTQTLAQGVTAASLRGRRPRVARLAAHLTCLVAVSALSTGCSLMPFGKGRSAKIAKAMRPELHEVKANGESECLAEDVTATATPGTTTPAEPATAACATCACGATASARTGGAAKPGTTTTTAAPVAPTVASPAAAAAAAAATVLPVATATPAALVRTPASAGRADRQLQRLMDGNKRFVEGESDHDLWTRALSRGELSATAATVTTTPIAVVIADGDLVPDALFDARPGELLVIPSPADIADETVVATLRDAVQHYEIPLIVVLGRRGGSGGGQPQRPFTPDVDSAARQASVRLGGGWAVEGGQGAEQASALMSVDRLVFSDASLGARVTVGRLKVIAANCDDASGQISLDLGMEAAPQPAPAVAPAIAPKPPAAELVGLPQD